MKSLDPLRAKKIFIRKELGHTAVNVREKKTTEDKALTNLPALLQEYHSLSPRYSLASSNFLALTCVFS